jgi:hypothetical protein
MTFEGGLNVRQFVKMLRFFSGAEVEKIYKAEFWQQQRKADGSARQQG